MIHGRVAVTGVGYSEIGRDTGLSEGELALQACRAAIADARLDRRDVDGLTMFPMRTSPPTSFQGPPLGDVQRALALPRLRFWQSAGHELAQFGALYSGIYALMAGVCTHVLAIRAHRRQSRRYMPNTSGVEGAWDEEAFSLPYGGAGGASRLAPWAARHMHEYGTTQEQLGAVVLTCRTHALGNPRAIWKKPITLDDYMASRWVCTPYKLFDCDYPVDGAVAVIMSRADVAGSTRKPVFVDSVGHATGPDTSWTEFPDLSYTASRYAAEQLWGGTDLRPGSVDVAELYDGFSWLAIAWLEGLGFVGPGEGGPFFESGGGRLGSTMPVCTDGGQLGVGRLHGFGKVAQAVMQLRGEAGENQVSGAKVALATAGGGPTGGAILLTAEPNR